MMYNAFREPFLSGSPLCGMCKKYTYQLYGNSEQLSYLQRCRIRYHFADVSKMVGGCFRFGNNHLGKCR